MSQKTIGLIGRKVGMTQIFQPDGTMVAVSVVQISPNTVTRIRTDERDGYTAVQLGAGERKKITKPLAGQLKDLPRVRYIREFRLDEVDDYTRGPGAQGRRDLRRGRARRRDRRSARARASRAP